MRKLVFIIMFVTCGFVYGQNEVFMYNPDGTKERFCVNNNVKYLQYKSSAIEDVQSLCSIARKVDTVMPDILKLTLDEANIERIERNASALDSVFLATELVYAKDSTILWCFNKILLQTKDDTELGDLLDLFEIPYNSYKPFGMAEYEYLVELSVSEAFQYANLLYETGAFNYVVPAFYRSNVFNNPLFSSQWGLKNVGQYCEVSHVDISAEPAWSLSTGKGIIIAVLDCGVQLNHPDLGANLLPGYDALGYGSNGGYSNSDYHGTACSGIIAALDNTIGIKGVAYESKIMPIRIGMWGGVSDEAAILAFDYVYTYGGDVISCSWGGGPNNPTLTNAINTIVNNGRNGLGCPVLFSSGNYHYYDTITDVSYPASLSKTIAIGAMSPCGERKSPNSCDGETGWGSNYGNGLDAVAPGVLIPTTTIGSGYLENYSGTSAACPHAAGVMALILSANPCLTATEARQILCSNCDKLDGYVYNFNKQYGTWNEETGYGKINAYKAVLAAMNMYSVNYTLSGGNGSPSENFWWVLSQQSCNLSSGQYYVKMYEFVQNITFPYAENPFIYAVANGYSAANPNNGQYFCSISNVTHTSATLKTWIYKILSNINGQQINLSIPVNPEDVEFEVSIMDVPETSIYIDNVSVVNTNYNRIAYNSIETSNFIVQGSSVVRLRAGKEILLGERTYIAPNASGDFLAYIMPFGDCENRNTQGEYGFLDLAFYNNEDENIENDAIVGFLSQASFGADEKEATSSLFIYPNPVTETFNIRLGNPSEKVRKVEVFNLQGALALSNDNPDENTVDANGLPAGMYLVRVTGSMGNVYFGKFVKE